MFLFSKNKKETANNLGQNHQNQIQAILPILKKISQGDFSEKLSELDNSNPDSEFILAINSMIDKLHLEKENQKKYAQNRLAKIIPIMEKAIRGDFSSRIEVPNIKDEFTEFIVTLNLMIDDLKELDNERRENTNNLQRKVKERTVELKDTVSYITKEKEKTDAILHSIGDGVFTLDRDLKITMFNRVAEKVTGYTADQAIGKQYQEIIKLINEIDEAICDQFIKNSLTSGEIIDAPNQTVLIRQDKNRIPVSGSAAPLKNKLGLVTGCVVVLRDVTKEREIDRAKTEFVSLASHQLRTPLSSVKWYAELLMAGDAGKITDNQQNYLQEIYNSNERMIALVNGLLNVSRIEMGTLIIKPVPVDFPLIAKSVLDELGPKIAEKKLNIKQIYEKGLPKINADEKIVRVILQNLITNAIKYTPNKGKVSITIKEDKTNVLIRVADNGYGIPKKQQANVYNKLFRADNIKERSTQGAGLGLYLMKAILDQVCGKTWFKSKQNKGATFYVSLPLSGMKEKEGTRNLT